MLLHTRPRRLVVSFAATISLALSLLAPVGVVGLVAAPAGAEPASVVVRAAFPEWIEGSALCAQPCLAGVERYRDGYAGHSLDGTSATVPAGTYRIAVPFIRLPSEDSSMGYLRGTVDGFTVVTSFAEATPFTFEADTDLGELAVVQPRYPAGELHREWPRWVLGSVFKMTLKASGYAPGSRVTLKTVACPGRRPVTFTSYDPSAVANKKLGMSLFRFGPRWRAWLEIRSPGRALHLEEFHVPLTGDAECAGSLLVGMRKYGADITWGHRTDNNWPQVGRTVGRTRTYVPSGYTVTWTWEVGKKVVKRGTRQRHRTLRIRKSFVGKRVRVITTISRGSEVVLRDRYSYGKGIRAGIYLPRHTP